VFINAVEVMLPLFPFRLFIGTKKGSCAAL